MHGSSLNFRNQIKHNKAEMILAIVQNRSVYMIVSCGNAETKMAKVELG